MAAAAAVLLATARAEGKTGRRLGLLGRLRARAREVEGREALGRLLVAWATAEGRTRASCRLVRPWWGAGWA